MKVRQLIQMLQNLPEDANVHLDDEGYPSVDGAFTPENYVGDEEDAPPPNVVLLEFSETKEE